MFWLWRRLCSDSPRGLCHTVPLSHVLCPMSFVLFLCSVSCGMCPVLSNTSVDIVSMWCHVKQLCSLNLTHTHCVMCVSCMFGCFRVSSVVCRSSTASQQCSTTAPQVPRHNCVTEPHHLMLTRSFLVLCWCRQAAQRVCHPMCPMLCVFCHVFCVLCHVCCVLCIVLCSVSDVWSFVLCGPHTNPQNCHHTFLLEVNDVVSEGRPFVSTRHIASL